MNSSISIRARIFIKLAFILYNMVFAIQLHQNATQNIHKQRKFKKLIKEPKLS